MFTEVNNKTGRNYNYDKDKIIFTNISNWMNCKLGELENLESQSQSKDLKTERQQGKIGVGR